ncbi:hypothetical protein GLS40_14405 [Pseudooceanicola sp. 216_PA32_1]|uniref:Uncharacterized protein n=1 Tax=Pseudooceanicola pacificus TaxID=2676438 RepID=A0A844WDH3_9RHOB|nr:hypothetical protein [Pseudooceanicola pacificus]MWB79228.1 hypothetical protein [Pseudooceanicola pacificus]
MTQDPKDNTPADSAAQPRQVEENWRKYDFAADCLIPCKAKEQTETPPSAIAAE